MRRLITLLACTALLATGLVLHDVTEDVEPASATASSVFGIHAFRAGSLQVLVTNNYAFMPSGSWRSNYINAGTIISNASPDIGFSQPPACELGIPCIAGALHNYGGPTDPVIVDPYYLNGDHLRNFVGGIGYTRPLYNTYFYPCADACQKVRVCEMIMEGLGVADGCLLNGWPSEDGLAVLHYMNAHIHG